MGSLRNNRHLVIMSRIPRTIWLSISGRISLFYRLPIHTVFALLTGSNYVYGLKPSNLEIKTAAYITNDLSFNPYANGPAL
jgi:hypothetical protein